jgi:hypothetical protein
MCPCPPATLASGLVESLAYLVTDLALLRERAEEVIERLTVQGDLLELSSVTTLEPGARNSWMFAASPAFVARPHGAVVLLGIAPDERSPVPSSLADRLRYEGCAHDLRAVPGQCSGEQRRSNRCSSARCSLRWDRGFESLSLQR